MTADREDTMPKIHYLVQDGTVRDVDAPLGSTVMRAAVNANVPGIVAECGGNAMCATCHVYAEDGPVSELPPRSDDEDEMLENTVGPRQDNSRLSCQLTVTEALDGLLVRVAEEDQ
jgi:2Fe-2S ferredoxin